MAMGPKSRYTLTEALGNQRSRDRMDAQRQIAGLSQGDQMVSLLTDVRTEMQASRREQERTNTLLEWVGGLLNEQLKQAADFRV